MEASRGARGLRRLSSSSLARNAGWMLLAQIGRVVCQAGYFVLIARGLGAHGFGAFAAALALVSLLAPFAALGSGDLLTMHVARDPQSFRSEWGNALAAIAVVAAPLSAIALGAAAVLITALPIRLVAALCLAELVFNRATETSAQAFRAVERMLVSGLLGVVPMAFRLGAAVAFVAAVDEQTAVAWANWYAVSTGAAAVLAVAVVTAVLGLPRFQRRPVRLRQGFFFSLAQSASNIYTDIDKTMLARLVSLEAAGIYAAAYRATAFAFLPIVSLLNAAYPRFFRAGEGGIEGSRRFARRLARPAIVYSLLASATLFLAAPIVPHVLGADYAGSVGALRWLAVLPLVQTAYYLPADALTGAGYQRLRSSLQVGAALLNVLLNLWLVPRYSLVGAAVATLVALGALALSLWIVVEIAMRRSSAAKEVPTDGRVGLAGVR